MRYLFALMLLVGLVGCQEKGPTAAEKAAIYSAAKTELADLLDRKEKLLQARRNAITNGVTLTPQEEADFDQTVRNVDTMIADVEKVIRENNPVTY
jgi:uncharacterized protein YhaN